MFIVRDRKSVFSSCPCYKCPVGLWGNLYKVLWASGLCFLLHVSLTLWLHIQSLGFPEQSPMSKTWKSFNAASGIFISQDLNTYFPSKQAYFRCKGPRQWITMRPMNKSSLRAELFEMWRCCPMHTQEKNHLFYNSTHYTNYFYHVIFTLNNSDISCLKAFEQDKRAYWSHLNPVKEHSLSWDLDEALGEVQPWAVQGIGVVAEGAGRTTASFRETASLLVGQH